MLYLVTVEKYSPAMYAVVKCNRTMRRQDETDQVWYEYVGTCPVCNQVHKYKTGLYWDVERFL